MQNDTNKLLEEALIQIGNKPFSGSDVLNYIMDRLDRRMSLEEIAEVSNLVEVQVQSGNKFRFFIERN